MGGCLRHISIITEPGAGDISCFTTASLSGESAMCYWHVAG